ncbi:FAD:protein FMN transferase [Roseibium sediminicola]|uniref:FAD:protein FMN transferase n=1 Tax=Roseibium sediminicola TaxID=2933272 RepID=A0ABT0GNW2_9HYPH|nr:FAD:protein FMN transferase [Roseibium sp. CAU 1639]MCK7611108.1 FAD:protein FMN transferase [Roseibium sp. CAU 1639]
MSPSTGTPRKFGRRRFLRICAAGAAGLALPVGAAFGDNKAQLHRWRGIALGAGAEINLLHEDAGEAQWLFGRIEAEIRRLEAIFSLYRPESELARLNTQGRLEAPSLDLVDLLGLCARVHAATEGAFDPTVQPLWVHYARQATGDTGTDFEAARRSTGLRHVSVEPGRIRYLRPGMAMTFNGIAQGYVTDRINSFLAANGCRDLLVDLGEIAARGLPDLDFDEEKGWPVTLRPVSEMPSAEAKIRLTDAAVASSARLGTTFDQAGRRSHILDPRTGRPVDGGLSGVSVLAPTAALADGLSTAALVCGEERLASALAGFPETRAFVVREDGAVRFLG